MMKKGIHNTTQSTSASARAVQISIAQLLPDASELHTQARHASCGPRPELIFGEALKPTPDAAHCLSVHESDARYDREVIRRVSLAAGKPDDLRVHHLGAGLRQDVVDLLPV